MFGTDHDDFVPRQPYQLGLPGIDCVLLRPADALAGSIHYYWSLTVTGARVRLPVIPDNALDLVLCPTAPGYAELYLPAERRVEIALDGPVRYVGVCLNPDRASSVLGQPIERLRCLAPGTETREALGLGRLIERLGERGADEADALSARLDECFAPRVSRSVDAALRGGEHERALLGHFLGTDEPARIGEVARRAGLSERQLRRETRRLLGLGPKKIQRVVRLQRALAELIDGSPQRAGYHDDAHRIRELRALSGWTPGQIRRMAERYNTARRRAGNLPSRKPPPERGR